MNIFMDFDEEKMTCKEAKKIRLFKDTFAVSNVQNTQNKRLWRKLSKDEKKGPPRLCVPLRSDRVAAA